MDIDNGYEKYLGFIEKNIRLKKGLYWIMFHMT